MSMIIRCIEVEGLDVWEVGYMDPDKGFVLYAQFDDMEEAEERCSKINGGMTEYESGEFMRLLGMVSEALIVISDTIARK